MLRRLTSERFFFKYMPFKGERDCINLKFSFQCFFSILAVFLLPPPHLRRTPVLWCKEWFYKIKSENEIFWHILISPRVIFHNDRKM